MGAVSLNLQFEWIMEKTREQRIAKENRLRKACRREKAQAAVLKKMFLCMLIRDFRTNVEEARLEAAEAKRVSDEKAAMAALFEEAAAAEKRLAEEKASRAKAMLKVMLKVMLNWKLSITFNEWQATVAQTKAEVEAEFQEAMQKAFWPCGDVLVHGDKEDKLREGQATAEPWLQRMTGVVVHDDVDHIQTSGGTPPVSGTPRRRPWLLLFSCIGLVCLVVLMAVMMSEDAHVENQKNFQDFERASPQDIQNAVNELKEETRAQKAIKHQKAKILKQENERAAKLWPTLKSKSKSTPRKRWLLMLKRSWKSVMQRTLMR